MWMSMGTKSVWWHVAFSGISKRARSSDLRQDVNVGSGLGSKDCRAGRKQGVRRANVSQRHPSLVQPRTQQLANSPAQLVAASAAKPSLFNHAKGDYCLYATSDVVHICKILIVLHVHLSLRLLLFCYDFTRLYIFISMSPPQRAWNKYLPNELEEMEIQAFLSALFKARMKGMC